MTIETTRGNEVGVEGRKLTVKERLEAGADAVLLARQAVARVKEELDAAKEAYERQIQDELVGKKFRVSGRLAFEQVQGQDGPEWDRSSGWLNDIEVSITSAFRCKENGEDDVLCCATLLDGGIEIRGHNVAVFLSDIELNPVESDSTDNPRNFGGVALRSNQ